MNGDVEENNYPTQEVELQEVLMREKEKNAELKEYLSHLLKENSDYKKKYNVLQQRITSLSSILEKNTRICQELYDDAKSALQLGTFTTVNNASHNSPQQPPENRVQNPRETVVKPNPQPGPSGVEKKQNRVNIGQLDLKELGKSLESGPVSTVVNGTNNSSRDEQLTTILEENTIVTSTEGALETAKDVYVRLSRLPRDIVQEHLHKSVDSSVNLSTMDPHFTSTPLKLETMKGLGLFPSGSQSDNQFVNKRRGYKIVKSPTRQKKAHNLAAKQKNLTENKELKNLVIDMKEERDIEQDVNPTNSRPPRRAKPLQLKEPSLNRKVRRS